MEPILIIKRRRSIIDYALGRKAIQDSGYIRIFRRRWLTVLTFEYKRNLDNSSDTGSRPVLNNSTTSSAINHLLSLF